MESGDTEVTQYHRVGNITNRYRSSKLVGHLNQENRRNGFRILNEQ